MQKDTKRSPNNLQCVNYNGNFAANDPSCPMWLQRRGRGTHTTDATTRRTQQTRGQPTDLVNPVKEPQTLHWTKTANAMPLGDEANNGDGDASMEFDA